MFSNKREKKSNRHLLLLLYIPVAILLYFLTNRLMPPEAYHVVYCSLDEMIPFCEVFLIPYCLWYALYAAIPIYTGAKETVVFRKLMGYIMLTFTIALLIYICCPTSQMLRPESFERDNILIRGVQWIYSVDKNTNVCPSSHVIIAIGLAFAACRCRVFEAIGWKIVIWIMVVLICISTVCIKQHSIIDVFAALPICALGYVVCFRKKEILNRTLHKKRNIYL